MKYPRQFIFEIKFHPWQENKPGQWKSLLEMRLFHSVTNKYFCNIPLICKRPALSFYL